MPIKIVTRGEWMARKPQEIVPLVTPVDTILFIQTGTKNNMTEAEICEWLPVLQMYQIETEHMCDIRYNWLVDFNGIIYEGRGWKIDVEKREPIYMPYAHKTIDIGFIGTFRGKRPPTKMERAATKLLELGMRDNFVVSNNTLKILNWNNFQHEY